jgi:hypothetical protein
MAGKLFWKTEPVSRGNTALISDRLNTHFLLVFVFAR